MSEKDHRNLICLLCFEAGVEDGEAENKKLKQKNEDLKRTIARQDVLIERLNGRLEK